MTGAGGDGASVRMESSGTVAGNLVQAGAIHGDVHFHESAERKVVPRQLPGAARQFVNRTVEQDALTTLLRSTTAGDATVVSSIDGTAGVGKSTLVVYWAHNMREEFADGELYVNLRGFDPTAAPMTSTEALGTFLAGLGTAAEQIPIDVDARAALFRTLVHGKRMLIVLDNAFSAEQVRHLLPGSPTCLVVLTSRNRLEDLVIREGATRMTLHVLKPDEARDLLGRYVGQQRVDTEPQAVTTLVEHCAGLPLALGIVAFRAAENPEFPLGVLVEELQDEQERLDALDAGGETGVRSVFSWSYRSLSTQAARMFRLLGLPTGPDISLAAAADLAGVPQREARGLLTELTRAHLVEQHSPGRYRFHDLLRAYAAECAAEDETADDRHAAVRRLLDHYLRTSYAIHQRLQAKARQLTPEPPASEIEGRTFADDDSGKDWWEAERANLVAAVRQAAQLGLHEHAWQLPHTLRYWFKIRSYTDEWIATHDIAIDAARQLSDLSAEAHLSLNIGSAYYALKQYEDSAAHKERSVLLFEELGDRNRQSIALMALAEAYTPLERYDDATDSLRTALDLEQEREDRYGQGIAHAGLGSVHLQLGQLDTALRHLEQARDCYREVGEQIGLGFVLHYLAEVHSAAGRAEEAIEMYREAVAYRREIGHRQGEATSLRGLGTALRESGDLSAARECWEQALSLFAELGNPQAEELHELLADMGS